MSRRPSKNLLPILLTGMGVFISIYCQRGSTPSSNQPAVALVVKTLNNPYFLDMRKGAERAAKREGVNLIVQAAERELDVEKQMQIIENLIQSRVSALCITPSGSTEIVPAIVKANRANIPVIIVDTKVNPEALREAGGRVDGFIGSDNFEGGKLAGEFLVKKTGGKANVAILEGIPGHETGDSRLKGFRQALASHLGMKIVSSQTANWERDQGYNVFQNILQSHPEVQALFACSDLMALGAVEAIATARRTGDILVVGFDAFAEAREAVRKGLMDATIAQSPFKMGELAVENTRHLLNGERIPKEVSVEIHLITKENANMNSASASVQ